MSEQSRGAIDIKNLGVVFNAGGNTVEAVSSVSMDVKPGEFVSLIGPSGCGKSTLLNIVAGFVKATSGDALLDGDAIKGPGSDRGVVFQQYSLFPWLSVRKNVEFGLKMKGVPAAQRVPQARTLLGLAGLLAFENHYPDQLSGGMKQRVGIVRALATSPQVLLMDEPFGALDAMTRDTMNLEIQRLWMIQKSTIVFVTHSIAEAVFLADRIILLSPRPGRIRSVTEVTFPRPRDMVVQTQPEFQDIVRHLRGELEDME